MNMTGRTGKTSAGKGGQPFTDHILSQMPCGSLETAEQVHFFPSVFHFIFVNWLAAKTASKMTQTIDYRTKRTRRRGFCTR